MGKHANKLSHFFKIGFSILGHKEKDFLNKSQPIRDLVGSSKGWVGLIQFTVQNKIYFQW